MDQPVKTLDFAAERLGERAVRTFARLTGLGESAAELEKARRALSRCLSRAQYEPTPEEIRGGRHLPTEWERWAFQYRRQVYQLSVRDGQALAVVRLVKERR
jgi:hypothetical protein